MSQLLGRLMVADVVLRTNYMIQQMQEEYKNKLLEEWKSLITQYYTLGYDNSGGRQDKVYRELMEILGDDCDILVDMEFEIIESIYGSEA